MLAVEVNNLTKQFGNFKAVNSISFEVSRGEIFGFLGANGAGKSTTIKILCGIQPPSSGDAIVLGIDLNKNRFQVKSRIGYMSQKFSLYEDLTVWENISFYGGIHRLSESEIQKQGKRILELSELVGKEKEEVHSLPLGWKQKLALGCSIIHDPDIVFLDEPTAGVDPRARRIFWDVIDDLKEQGKTIFVTSHYMDEVEACDRIAIMHRGRILALDSPNQLKKEQIPYSIFEIHSEEAEEWKRQMDDWDEVESAEPYGLGLHVLVERGKESTFENRCKKLAKAKNKSGKELDWKQIQPSLEDVFVFLIQREEEHVA